MSDGMAVVQHDSDAQSLSFVLADHVSLDGHAAADDLRRDLRLNLHQRLGVLLENVNQTGIQDETVFDGLRPTLGQFPFAQRR